MKKVNAILLVILCLAVSCKKSNDDKQNSTNVETPLKAAVENRVPADTIYAAPSAAANFGSKFHATTAGNIIKLGCRMPEAGTYTVTLWDFDFESKILETNVNITNTNEFAYGVITPYSITPNKSYVISVNNVSGGVAKNYFQLYKLPVTAINIYPFTVGNIVIEEPLFKSGSSPLFPDQNNSSDFPFIRGVADITFEKAM